MSLVRSLIVALLAMLAARPICGLLDSRRASLRRMAWVLLLAPYFTPVLLTGYAYANFSLSLVHHPVLNEIFYTLLLCWKFTPLAAVIRHFTPAPVSPEAIHCWRLMPARTPLQMCLFHARYARGAIAGFAVVFLTAFSEFEMASLMGIRSWTVALFDAHAGGLALTESLRRMFWPFLVQAAAIALCAAMLGRRQVLPVRQIASSATMNWLGWCVLAAGFVMVVGVPGVRLLWGALQGAGMLLQNFMLGREIMSSLLFAAGATLVATILVIGLAAAARLRHGAMLFRVVFAAVVCAGLLGPLVLSLTALSALQQSWWIALRDTPVPLVLVLGLVLVPVAFVLRRILEATAHRSALQLAMLMPKSAAASDLTWRLSTSGRFWAIGLLFVWAYWDLTASAILAPTAMTPVTVRLYNLMHYGQIAALSAMTCVTFLAPVSILLLALATRRWWAPR